MSPLWKKKQNPISRFVNEIRSSRHGESLVVQTGFPTSLIDLVVKNRSRFIKTKNTNNERYDSFKPNKDRRRLSSKKMEREDDRHRDQDSRTVNEDDRHRDQAEKKVDHVDDKEMDAKKEDNDGGCESEFKIEKCANGGFTKLVKMLFVLILGLGTKKFAVADLDSNLNCNG